MLKSNQSLSLNISIWFFLPEKFQDLFLKMRKKSGLEILPMHSLKKRKIMNLLNNNYGNISLKELEITSILCFASHLLETNSEKELRNSQLSSMNVPSIGSSHGPKKPWLPSLKVSSKNSINFNVMKKQKKISDFIWVMYILWSPTFVMFSTLKWEDKSMLLLNLIYHIWLLIKIFISLNIMEN